jgi:hypothetical protein
MLFIVWHLLHFTIVKIGRSTRRAQGPDDRGLALPDGRRELPAWWMVLIYLLALAALGLHLAHGVFSAQQTLGSRDPQGPAGPRASATSSQPWSSSASRSRRWPSSSAW